MSMKKNLPTARAPQRQRGMERVSALIEAAIAVFAEKGYAAATMTEIAARADAPIGSLYQFFPNKELIADALLRRYLELAVDALSRLESVAAAHQPAALAQGLLRVFVDLKTERAAILSLLEALRHERAELGAEFRAAMLAHLQKLLHLLAVELPPARAATAAVTILQQMKAAAELGTHAGTAAADAARKELARMLMLYLTDLSETAAPIPAKPLRGTAKVRR